jgi:hypothetical protein
MKKIGTRNPNPIPSSLTRKSLFGQEKQETDEQRERNGETEREARQPRQRGAQPFDVDFKTGEKQQHAQAKGAQHLHRRVDARPPEDGRSHHDAEDDLEHRAWHRQPGQQAENDGNENGDPGDDQHAVERDRSHYLKHHRRRFP